MRTKKLGLLSLCLTLPFLLSNSPSPYPYPAPYEDASYTPFVITYEEEVSRYKYVTTLTNNGEGYISLEATYLVDAFFVYTDEVKIEDYNYLPPAKSKELTFYKHTYTEDNELIIHGYTADRFMADVTYTYESELVKTEDTLNINEHSIPRYRYEVIFEPSGLTSNYFEAILDFETVDGSCSVNFFNRSDGTYAFYTFEEIDEASFTITNVIFIAGLGYKTINYSHVRYIVLIFLVGIVGLNILISLFAVTIVLIIKKVQRKKAKSIDNPTF